MVYRAVTDFVATDSAAIASAAADGIGAVVAYMRTAGVDLDRIEGMGVILPEGAGSTLSVACDEATFTGALPEGIEIPVYVERLAVIGALSMAMLSNLPLPASFLYVAIGETLDSCLMIDGEVHRGTHWRAGRIEALPVPAQDGSITTLGSVSSFAPLRARLAGADFRAGGSEALYRAQREHPGIVETWCREAGDALFLGLQAAQAYLDLGGICLRIDPPTAIGDRLVDRIRKGFDRLPDLGLTVPRLMSDYPPRNSLATAAAIMALHESFASKPEGPRLKPAADAPEATIS
jgi:predicted NBD/HSP70 family sugar kinase